MNRGAKSIALEENTGKIFLLLLISWRFLREDSKSMNHRRKKVDKLKLSVIEISGLWMLHLRNKKDKP